MIEKSQLLTQGQMIATDDPKVVVSTLLGSCVAVCLWDPLARAGGMNHMLLADHLVDGMQRSREGVHAMELLVNAVLKLGGRRSRLVAKIFGGANMLNGSLGIGRANAQFASEFLHHERIFVAGQSLGGTRARQLLFWPATGAVRQRKVFLEEKELPTLLPATPRNCDANDLELL